MEISNSQKIEALRRTLGYFGNIRCLCPKCHAAYIMSGFVCLHCGYEVNDEEL